MMLLIIVLSLLLIVFAILMLIRNEWVYDRLMELNRFENGIHLIREYDDYFDIYIRFWIWDINKFKKNSSM